MQFGQYTMLEETRYNQELCTYCKFLDTWVELGIAETHLKSSDVRLCACLWTPHIIVLFCFIWGCCWFLSLSLFVCLGVSSLFFWGGGGGARNAATMVSFINHKRLPERRKVSTESSQPETWRFSRANSLDTWTPPNVRRGSCTFLVLMASNIPLSDLMTAVVYPPSA